MSEQTHERADRSAEAAAVILCDVRPWLWPALQRLPDEKLLALINWDILRAWERALREFQSSGGTEATKEETKR